MEVWRFTGGVVSTTPGVLLFYLLAVHGSASGLTMLCCSLCLAIHAAERPEPGPAAATAASAAGSPPTEHASPQARCEPAAAAAAPTGSGNGSSSSPRFSALRGLQPVQQPAFARAQQSCSSPGPTCPHSVSGPTAAAAAAKAAAATTGRCIQQPCWCPCLLCPHRPCAE
eukprot:scaffold193327_cov13-Tisochrysis_lutea.AAC.2